MLHGFGAKASWETLAIHNHQVMLNGIKNRVHQSSVIENQQLWLYCWVRPTCLVGSRPTETWNNAETRAMDCWKSYNWVCPRMRGAPKLFFQTGSMSWESMNWRGTLIHPFYPIFIFRQRSAKSSKRSQPVTPLNLQGPQSRCDSMVGVFFSKFLGIGYWPSNTTFRSSADDWIAKIIKHHQTRHHSPVILSCLSYFQPRRVKRGVAVSHEASNSTDPEANSADWVLL